MSAKMVSTPTYLHNHQFVLNVYKGWPSFHDSEVVSILLDRSKILFGEVCNARVELVVHCFAMLSEVLPSGFHRLTNHALIHFEFDAVSDVTLSDFNHQNALFDLKFCELPLDESGNHSFRVVLNPAFGIGGEFTASKGRVISVRQCDEKGKVEIS